MQCDPVSCQKHLSLLYLFLSSFSASIIKHRSDFHRSRTRRLRSGSAFPIGRLLDLILPFFEPAIGNGAVDPADDLVGRLIVRQAGAGIEDVVDRVLDPRFHEVLDVLGHADVRAFEGVAEHLLQWTADGEAGAVLLHRRHEEFNDVWVGRFARVAQDCLSEVEGAEGSEWHLIPTGIQSVGLFEGREPLTGVIHDQVSDLDRV